MKTQTQRKYDIGNMFGPEVFVDTWILVTDSNNCDVQVTIDDLMEDIPISQDGRYEKVFYDGQVWWIPKELHFPM